MGMMVDSPLDDYHEVLGASSITRDNRSDMEMVGPTTRFWHAWASGMTERNGSV